MASLHRSSIRRIGAALWAAAALAVFAPAAPASAQNFFEALFGGAPRRQELPPQASSFADPFGNGRETRRDTGGYGSGTAFCVRTCDGRYFPIQRHAGASPAETCRSFCPAAKTAVFTGSKIDTAVAPNGARYADIDNAFVYRDRVVSNCSCNGKDGLGLARVDTSSDPTLRPGDIVATEAGLATFHGNGKSKTAEFTPISASSGEWARRLSDIKVRPAPPMHPVADVAEDDGKPALRKGRAQASR